MADNNSEIIEKTLDIIKSCLVPQLLNDLDSQPIGSDDFKEYRLAAKENIRLLLDILHHNCHLLSDKIYDNQLLQLKVNLLLITCEQIEPNQYFHSDDKDLLDSLWKITLDNVKFFEDDVFNQLIKHCKKSLTKTEWKKQFGLTNGFPSVCKILFQHKSHLINNDVLMFMLSVGSNLVAHYDPDLVQRIGLKIYMYILSFANHNHLKELNIHQVIFNELLPLIQRSNEIEYNVYLYECFFLILRLEDIPPKAKWCSKYDTLISKLMNHFSFENDSKLSRLLIYQLVRFYSEGYCDQLQLKSLEELEGMNDWSYFDEIKEKIKTPNYKAMRWIHKIMDMMIRESARLFSNNQETKFFLCMFNILYIITIGSISPSHFHLVLENFTKKFILILLKVANLYKTNHDILSLILNLFSTIEEHHQSNENIVLILQKLRNHEIFSISLKK